MEYGDDVGIYERFNTNGGLSMDKKEEMLREAVHEHYQCNGKYACEEQIDKIDKPIIGNCLDNPNSSFIPIEYCGAYQENRHNPELHYGEGGVKGLQVTPNSPYLQNGELSSTDKDSVEIMDRFVQQLHCKDLYDKSALSEVYPIIEEISDDEFARIKEGALFVSHLDNPGKHGQNGI